MRDWYQQFHLGGTIFKWIHQLFSDKENLKSEPRVLNGLDIGVGSSVIYPILGVKEYDWNFVGTDIWQNSLDVAQKIIDNNELGSKIKLKHQPHHKRIFKNVVSDTWHYDFCVWNPPFFSSMIERDPRHSVKNIQSLKTEDVTEGGEIGFICRMIKESYIYKNQIKWFTWFIAKKMDFEFVKNYIKWMIKDEIEMYEGTIEMGHTKRWLLGWKYLNQ